MKKKLLASVVAIALVACCVIGGTLAWLTDKTDPITNTFTVGDVNIDLTETDGTLTSDGSRSFHIVPGVDIDKDPTVTVKAGSEDCYLFVKIDESANWIDGMTYSVDRDAGWLDLPGVSGVYYQEVSASDADQVINVLTNQKVVVSDEITKEMLNAIETAPTLTFTAYAVQSAGINSATDAWTEVNG